MSKPPEKKPEAEVKVIRVAVVHRAPTPTRLQKAIAFMKSRVGVTTMKHSLQKAEYGDTSSSPPERRNFHQEARASGKVKKPATKEPDLIEGALRDMKANVGTGQIRNPNRKEGVAPERSVRGSGAPLAAAGKMYSAGGTPTPKNRGTSGHTTYSYGGHWPMVTHMPEHKLLVVHRHDYGGPTTRILGQIDKHKMLSKIFPGHKIVSVDHPDYQQSARVMKQAAGGNLKALHGHLSHMAEFHGTRKNAVGAVADPAKAKRFANDAAHVSKLMSLKKQARIRHGLAMLKVALERGESLAKTIKRFDADQPKVHSGRFGDSEGRSSNAKRQRSKFLEGDRGTSGVHEEGVKRLNGYLKGIGLHAEPGEPWDDSDKKLMGSRGRNVVSSFEGSGPHREQLIHEVGHAQQTPAGMSLPEYQRRLGAPGERDAAKFSGLGSKEETKAHVAEAGISRRAGLPTFKDPQPRSAVDPRGSQDAVASHQAHQNQKKLDLGIHRFNRETGVKEPQLDVHAQINRRAIGESRQAVSFGKLKLRNMKKSSEEVRGFLNRLAKAGPVKRANKEKKAEWEMDDGVSSWDENDADSKRGSRSKRKDDTDPLANSEFHDRMDHMFGADPRQSKHNRIMGAPKRNIPGPKPPDFPRPYKKKTMGPIVKAKIDDVRHGKTGRDDDPDDDAITNKVRDRNERNPGAVIPRTFDELRHAFVNRRVRSYHRVANSITGPAPGKLTGGDSIKDKQGRDGVPQQLDKSAVAPPAPSPAPTPTPAPPSSPSPGQTSTPPASPGIVSRAASAVRGALTGSPASSKGDEFGMIEGG